MSFNDITKPVYFQAIRLMFSSEPMSQGMGALDEFVRTAAPHPIWDKLREIRFEQELPDLTEWVRKGLAAHEEHVSILYFSLSDMGDDIELVFLSPKDKSRPDAEDAPLAESSWPDAPCQVLKQIYELTESELSDGKGDYTDDNVRWIIETCYPLTYAGLAVNQVMRNLPPEVLIGKDTRRRVAVYFAEGDDFDLGEITRQGFSYCEIPDFAR